MTAIEPHRLKLESFYSFVTSALETDQIEVHPLAGDASNRRYYRVVVGEASSVLMVWEPFQDDDTYPFLSVLNHFLKNDVQVPKVIAKSPEGGFVLLEDLGDLTLERKFWESQNQDQAVPAYRLAIDELIKIHYMSSKRVDGPSCTAFSVAFDTEKLLWEMNYMLRYFIEGLCQIRLSSVESDLLSVTFQTICQKLSDQPRFVTHRDYHSRNLMIKLGKMRVIDFQDARMGPIQYDLVSLLRDSYVDLNETIAQGLIDYYFVRRSECQAPKISQDEFKMIYELQTIQRCLKACGSFSSFYVMRKDMRYLKYISKTLRTVRTSISYFPEHSRFLDFLQSNGVFDRDYNAS